MAVMVVMMVAVVIVVMVGVFWNLLAQHELQTNPEKFH